MMARMAKTMSSSGGFIARLIASGTIVAELSMPQRQIIIYKVTSQ